MSIVAMSLLQQCKKLTQIIYDPIKGLIGKSMPVVKNPPVSLGIDIGSHSVKVVALDHGKDPNVLLGYALEKVIEKNQADALSKALTKISVLVGSPAAIGVAGQGVVCRYVELPLMSSSELQSAMKFEIEKYVPFPLAEVVCDHAIVQEMKDKAKMVVLIVAAKNEIVTRRSQMLAEMDINLRAIDLDCLALANFFSSFDPQSKKGSCVAIMHLGRSLSSINIMIDGIPYLSRDIFIGGDDINKKIMEHFEVAALEAERLKLERKKGDDSLDRVWDSVLSNLTGEVRVSLDYFEARTNRSVERVYVSGGTSRLLGLLDYLHHYLAIDVKPLDYASRLAFGPGVKQDEFCAMAEFFPIALGLAKRI